MDIHSCVFQVLLIYSTLKINELIVCLLSSWLPLMLAVGSWFTALQSVDLGSYAGLYMGLSMKWRNIEKITLFAIWVRKIGSMAPKKMSAIDLTRIVFKQMFEQIKAF